MPRPVRARFAPSPTGYLHVGGARTALFNWLFARHEGGAFVLRLEDTDVARSYAEAERDLIRDLKWLGLDWDEGPEARVPDAPQPKGAEAGESPKGVSFQPKGLTDEATKSLSHPAGSPSDSRGLTSPRPPSDRPKSEQKGVGGTYGPYRQSERLALYRGVVETLTAKGKAYKCYCTDEEVEARRQAALAAGQLPHYDGRCRNLSEAEARRCEAEGRRPSVRFVVEYDEVVLDDVVRGEVRFKRGMVGDFVILRSDGMPTYNFACVVDDWKMEISHVIRGEEHLSNTLRQVLLYRELGVAAPVFAHLPLVLAPDRSKLSKRHGATSVGEMRSLGYPAEAILNHLVLLGWSPGDDKEILTLAEMVGRFTLERISRSPSVFDQAKLDWITLQHVKTMAVDQVVEGMRPFLEAKGLGDADPELVRRTAQALKETGKRFAELAEDAAVFLESGRVVPAELAVKLKTPTAARALASFLEALKAMRTVDRASVSEALRNLVAETGLKKGELFMPVRIALTGATKGPEIPVVVEVLGRERAVEGLRRALALAEE